MNTGLDLSPVPLERRRASLVDVAFLFAGANIVTTTLVTGGALGVRASSGRALVIVLLGVVVGTLPLALLARMGPRYGESEPMLL